MSSFQPALNHGPESSNSLEVSLVQHLQYITFVGKNKFSIIKIKGTTYKNVASFYKKHTLYLTRKKLIRISHCIPYLKKVFSGSWLS